MAVIDPICNVLTRHGSSVTNAIASINLTISIDSLLAIVSDPLVRLSYGCRRSLTFWSICFLFLLHWILLSSLSIQRRSRKTLLSS